MFCKDFRTIRRLCAHEIYFPVFKFTRTVLIQVVPLLVVFFSKLLSFYRKERKVPQSLFLLFVQWL
ncbi:hypothetical protein C7N43_23750 [Sphingobacteriales bacterium UPWRP_1]|nr:hypothetical protein BVG80_06715 [Sphingobacteriales bacterium TSM_CSM]PSJ74505.1 hypothetical protein C7N43_23750 [Sphingobacteriales bacterium UPWRP_1]